MRIEHVPQYPIAFSAIPPDAHEKNLRNIKLALELWRGRNVRTHTSLILDLRNGFLMYHVDVKKIRTKVISSVLPDSSNLSGEVLRMRPLLVRKL